MSTGRPPDVGGAERMHSMTAVCQCHPSAGRRVGVRAVCFDANAFTLPAPARSK